MYELLFSFKFYWQFNFLPLPGPFFLGLCLLWLIWKQFFSCLVVLLQSLAGVKSVFAKINLYDLLSCSIFRFLLALWEMQQAESSFLCRIINSVAFLVHMFQVRQNGELYLSLLHPSWKLGSAGHRHTLFLFSPATFGYQCWMNTTCFGVRGLWGLTCLLCTSLRTEATLERCFRIFGSWEG